jgi:hypothetical protein
VEGGFVAFWCPGCKQAHLIPVATGDPKVDWKFNSSYERPTFIPSVLVRWSHPKGYTNENPAPLGFPEQKDRPDMWAEEGCHSHVCDGRIVFLADCAHSLAGRTVPLEAF